MSSVYRETTVTLTKEEREILKSAIEICRSISNDCNDEDLFTDASTIFACIWEEYENDEVPSVIHIYE